MDYKEAWKTIKITLKASLLVRESELVDADDNEGVQLAKAILEAMEYCEKSIEEEERNGL